MTEKKLKKAAKDIKMPDELKNRIMTQCMNAPAVEESDSGDEQVFVVEHGRMHRITRTFAGIAACAVLVSVIGTTGYLMSRPDVSDSVDPAYSDVVKSNAPFGDLSGLGLMIERYDSQDIVRIKDELKAPIAEFFNSMEWNEINLDSIDSTSGNKTMIYEMTIERPNPVTGEIEPEILEIYDTGIMAYCPANADPKVYSVDFNALAPLLKAAYEGSRDVPAIDDAVRAAFDKCTLGAMDRYFEMTDIEMTDEKLKQFLAVLGNEEWVEVDALPEYARRHGNIFGGMYNDGDLYYQMSITQTGYMIFTATDGYGNVKAEPFVYRIDADSIREKFNRIAYGEGVTGKDAPFTGNELIEYASIAPDNENIPVSPRTSAEIKSILMEHYWVELPAESIDQSDEYFLTLSSSSSTMMFGRKYILYADENGAKYYDIHQVTGGISDEGAERGIRQLLTAAVIGPISSEPPFIGISKEELDLVCESTAGIASLTDADLEELEYAMSSLSWENYDTFPDFSYEDETGSAPIALIYSTSEDAGKQFALLFYYDNTVEFSRSSADGMPVLRYCNVTAIGTTASDIIAQFAENVINADMTIMD